MPRYTTYLLPSAPISALDEVMRVVGQKGSEKEGEPDVDVEKVEMKYTLDASLSTFRTLWSIGHIKKVVDENGGVVNHASVLGAGSGVIPDGVDDLSDKEGVVGGLLSSLPASAEEWNQHRLSKEEVESYWKNGYLSNVECLSEEECDMLMKDLTALSDPVHLHPGRCLFHEVHQNQSGDDSAVLFHALGQWRITPAFHDLIYHPAITTKVAQLLLKSREIAPVRFWHDQLFAKPPHHGGCVAWHQDYSYWTRTKPMQHITVHIALEDQTRNNGGLSYIPASHTWTRNGGPLPLLDCNFGDMEGIKTILNGEERAAFKVVSANLKKGEAAFHHPLSVHGSYANNSEYWRRAAVVNYFADGVMSDTDEPLLQGIQAIPKGVQLDGKFFPLVYSPSQHSIPPPSS